MKHCFDKFLTTALVAAIIALSGGATATAGQLAGRVLDSETGIPVWGANIRVVELDSVTETTKKGLFDFERIPDGEYQLVATHVAYDRSDTLRVTVSDATDLEIRLIPMPWVLDDIVVTGPRSTKHWNRQLVSRLTTTLAVKGRPSVV